MSGDVQPRKRKDKKKKKDELGVEEPRGTAAVLGDGDVFIHSQQEHGTGGHWCAKLIFFSLLAVLITLIGLIILENRGLTELEANSVESQYSGILEGWLEDAPGDDHHDEHTLDLKHDDDEEDEDEHNVEESDHEDEDHDEEEEHEDEEDLEDDEEENDQEDHDEDKESHEEDTEADEDEMDQDKSHEKNTEVDEDEEENVASNEAESNEDQDDNQSEENLQEDDDEEGEEKVYYKQYNYNENDDDDEESDENGDDKYADEDQNNEYDDENDDDDDDDDDDDQKDKDDENDEQESKEDQNDDYEGQNYKDVGQSDDESIEDNNDRYSDNDDDSKELKTQDAEFSNEVVYDNNNDHDDNDSNEQKDNKQDNEDEEEQADDSQEDEEEEEEIEKIEKEIIDEDEDSNEIVASRNVDEDEQEESKEDQEADDDDDDDDNDLRDQEDDDDEPPLERITAPPAGKPFVEIEEEVIEKPINTLAEEEEYEKRQEQLRREEEEAAQESQMWLKLAVGGALLVATHAVLRRATAPRDIPEPDELTREETPIVDRRMTITPEQSPPLTQIAREIEEEVFKKPAPVTKSAPIVKQDSEEEVIVKKAPLEEKAPVVDTKDDQELYSDEEEEVEDEEEEEEEDIEEPVKETVPKKTVPVVEQKPTEDSEPEDVEIIDDEQIEEELEDEENEDEEEISDVDDTELLTRLEAKYGRLPEPERFGKKPESFVPKHKDGGNSIEDEWPGEPSDAYWRTELNVAEEELRQGAWSACERRVSAAALASSGRARWLAARSLDLAAEEKKDNSLLSRAIAAYLHLLKMNERLSDKKLLEVAERAIQRIQFRGTYLNAEPIYRLLIRRFPNDVSYRNNLTVSFLMANRADLADEVLKETLRLWPNDRVALAHHGFVLKTKYNKLEEAVNALYKALHGDAGPANEPRFYYHLGDALLLLGRSAEAHEVHKRGAALGHFLSPAQRSLYNVPRLRSRPWWPVEETPYVNLARALERSWREILKEGEAAKALYEKEKEGLKERGEWTQLDLFVRGAEVAGRCARAPVTCGIVRGEAAAARCRRGQVKFSALAAGTHVRAHVGPTNCRLRMHLGLSNTKDTYIRVDKETRQWQTGKTFMFDDSFEHEVWHNGSGTRLVLIVDVWHPDLSAHERRTLPAI